MVGLFKIIDDDSFYYYEEIHLIKNVMHCYSTKTIIFGNSTSYDFACGVIMDDGKKLTDFKRKSPGLISGEISEDDKSEYSGLYHNHERITYLSAKIREKKYIDDWKRNKYLSVIDGGELDSDGRHDYFDKKTWINLGAVKKVIRFYKDRVVTKTSYPIIGNKYSELTLDEIESIKVKNHLIVITRKFRDEKPMNNLKWDNDILPNLIKNWGIKNDVNVEI